MQNTMWRTVLTAPGQFEQQQVPVPMPGPGEVLLQVTHIGVCGSDISAFYNRHPYIHCPIVLGHEFAGVVAAVGSNVQAPAPGTRISVIPHLVCGVCPACRQAQYNLCNALRCIGAQADGGHAEFVIVPAGMAISIPDAMSLEDAALVEPAAVGYHGIKRAHIQPDDRVLIVGAGPIGNFTMQSARVLGAKAVYIADIASDRLALAASLGADGIIDLSTETLADGITRLVDGPEAITVYADCVGGRGDVLNLLIATATRGSRLAVIGVLGNNYHLPLLPDFIEHELTLYGTTMYVPQDYRDVIAHLAAGRIRTAGMVSHHYRMNEIPDAFAMIDGKKEAFFKIVFTDVK